MRTFRRLSEAIVLFSAPFADGRLVQCGAGDGDGVADTGSIQAPHGANNCTSAVRGLIPCRKLRFDQVVDELSY